MLQYFRLKQKLQETDSVVSFETTEGTRVDISKKFIKKDDVGNYYFAKTVYSFKRKTTILTKTFVVMGAFYVCECGEPASFEADGAPIVRPTDLIGFKELNDARGKQDAEETYRS